MSGRADIKCPKCQGGIMKYSAGEVATQPYEPLLEGASQLSDQPQVGAYAHYQCDKCDHRRAADG